MTKKKSKDKGKISIQFLIFSLLVVALVSLPRPIYQLGRDNQIVKVAYAQDEKKDGKLAKKAARDEYKKLVKKVKSEYRSTRDQAKRIFHQELDSAETKNDRIEARKRYLQTIREAKQKRDAALQDAKKLFLKTDSM